MAEVISAGMVVRLKSGGPKMTVEWTRDGIAMCSWFDVKDTQHTKPFKSDALELVTG